MKDPLLNTCCKVYPECKCSSTAAKVARKMKELHAQTLAHEKGVACEEDDCQDCCGEFCGHEFEDYTCLNCGASTDGSDEASRAHELSEGDR